MILKPPIFTELNRSHPLARDLIFGGLCNEGSGDEILDSSGRRHNGTAHHGFWVPGKFGSALDFNGVNPELITNGIFSAWTGDNPDGWVVTGESGTDPEVSEVGTGESHGGTGTGMCNIYTSDGTYVQLAQSINLVVGRKYELTITIDTVAIGRILIAINGDVHSFTTIGEKSFVFVAAESTMNLIIKRSSICDVTFDDVSVKAVLDYITIPDHDDFTPASTPMSIAAWVNMRNAADFFIASKGQYNINGEWRFRTAAGKLRFQQFDESVPDCSRGRGYNTVLTAYEDEWIHVAATCDEGTVNTGISLYLNGLQVDDYAVSNGLFVSVENLDGPVWIGRDGGQFSNGLIDNVMIWKRELSAVEMLSHYLNSFQAFEPEPITAAPLAAVVPWEN